MVASSGAANNNTSNDTSHAEGGDNAAKDENLITNDPNKVRKIKYQILS